MKNPIHQNGVRCDLSGTSHCAAYNLRKTARAVTNLYDSVLEASGVRSTQFAILVAVARAQPVSIGRLSELLLIDRTTLTRSLGLMEKEGLLTISQRSTMRQRFVILTSKGSHSLERSVKLWRKVQKRFLAVIDEQKWRDLEKELERLSAAALKLGSSRRKA